MNKRKKLLAAGVVKDLWFQSRKEYDIYIYRMKHRGTEFQIAETCQKKDGSFLARIVVEHNGNELIRLFE